MCALTALNIYFARKQPNQINTKKSLDKCQQAPGKCIPKEKTASTGEGKENEAKQKKVSTKEGKQKEMPSNINTSRKNHKIHEQHNPQKLAEKEVTNTPYRNHITGIYDSYLCIQVSALHC